MPRMRMFAGPNGSGKSVLKSFLRPELLGVYLNPDEIEARIKRERRLDLRPLGIVANREEILTFFSESQFLRAEGLQETVAQLRFSDGLIDFGAVEVNAYFASVVVDFVRQEFLKTRASFTFETVMSHPGKVAVLEQAQQAGYRTYLYYVATDAPEINVSRVRNRVALGGHPVPEDKIVNRYHRSLALLLEAIRHTHRAYIFDNSTDSADHKYTWLAEITNGQSLVLKVDRVPAWFKRSVLDRIRGGVT